MVFVMVITAHVLIVQAFQMVILKKMLVVTVVVMVLHVNMLYGNHLSRLIITLVALA